MDIDEQRESLCAAAHQLAAAGLTVGTGGNLSIRVEDAVLLTPSGCRLESVKPEQLVIVDLEGSVVVPTPYRPTSELRFHLDIYRTTSASAVAHAHPVASVALANIVDELPPIHYTAAMIGGSVRVAPYAVFGSQELSDAVTTALHERTAALMRNHGSVAIGGDVVDTSGCGDAFSAAFLVARGHGLSLLQSAQVGCAVAGQVAEGLGSDHGGFTWAEMSGAATA